MTKKICIIVVIICIIGCSESENEKQYTFPVVDGVVWKYLRIWAEEFPDSGITDTLAIDICTVLLTRYPTFYSYADVFELKVSSQNILPGSVTDSFYTSVWYQNTDNDFREIAYHSAGNPVVYPKLQGKSLIHFGYFPLPGSPDFQTTESDTFFRNRLVLDYPLTTGKKWTSFTDPWRAECRMKGKKTVLTPLGSYSAFEIEHINWDFEGIDTSFVFYSYYADPGLICRTMRYDETDFPGKNPVCSVKKRFLENIRLIEYRLINN